MTNEPIVTGDPLPPELQASNFIHNLNEYKEGPDKDFSIVVDAETVETRLQKVMSHVELLNETVSQMPDEHQDLKRKYTAKAKSVTAYGKTLVERIKAKETDNTYEEIIVEISAPLKGTVEHMFDKVLEIARENGGSLVDQRQTALRNLSESPMSFTKIEFYIRFTNKFNPGKKVLQ